MLLLLLVVMAVMVCSSSVLLHTLQLRTLPLLCLP
jgi:hypothetical protein